jgi:chromosome partition protein MukE
LSELGAPFPDLASAIEAEEFPEVDLALRRGRHIDRDDEAWYAYVTEAQAQLERFYRRLGCELVHKSDGFFYLLPTNDRVPRRHLPVGDMLVGQALALLYLDPTTVQRGGTIDTSDVLAQLDGIVGTDALIRAFNPKRRRHDERIAQQTVRKKVAEAVRRLARLGFVDALDGERLRLRASLLRFADPVRELGEPAEALARLIARGEVALAEQDASSASDVDADSDRDSDADSDRDSDADSDSDPDSAADSDSDPDSDSDSDSDPDSDADADSDADPAADSDSDPDSDSDSDSDPDSAADPLGGDLDDDDRD